MTQWTGDGMQGDLSQEDGQVIDFTRAKENRMAEKRRANERVFFRNLLSVFSLVSPEKMTPIDMIEVSEDGCSFQVPFNPDAVWPNSMKNIPIRLYFSQDTYLEIHVKIQNSKPSIDQQNRYVRYGCAVDQTTQSYAAYRLFVQFLKVYSEQAHKDLGNISVFYL